MRRILIVLAIGSYAVLGLYDVLTGRMRAGVAEVLLAVVNALLLL